MKTGVGVVEVEERFSWEQLNVIQERLGTRPPSPASHLRRHLTFSLDILNIKAKIYK